jgi:hypothetical protein
LFVIPGGNLRLLLPVLHINCEFALHRGDSFLAFALRPTSDLRDSVRET